MHNINLCKATSTKNHQRKTGARLAQSVEHQTFNLRVKGSSPLLGAPYFCACSDSKKLGDIEPIFFNISIGTDKEVKFKLSIQNSKQRLTLQLLLDGPCIVCNSKCVFEFGSQRTHLASLGSNIIGLKMYLANMGLEPMTFALLARRSNQLS